MNRESARRRTHRNTSEPLVQVYSAGRVGPVSSSMPIGMLDPRTTTSGQTAQRALAAASSLASPPRVVSQQAVRDPRSISQGPSRAARSLAASVSSSRSAPTDHGLIMEREPLRLAPGEPLWVFGYGSIVWKVGFDFDERVICSARGYRRRFYQGSTDHRGTPEFPGRTVTLEPCDADVNPPCWGRLPRASRASGRGARDTRGEGETVRQTDQAGPYDDNGDVVVRDAVTYIATGASENLNWLGEASIEEVAETIATAVGPSGANSEYLLNLADAIGAASEFTTRTWTSLSGG